MNSEIKKLAEESGFILWADEPWNPGEIIDWSSRYDQELEQFAKALIQECMDCAEWVGKHNNHPIEPTNTAYTIINRIKTRFELE